MGFAWRSNRMMQQPYLQNTYTKRTGGLVHTEKYQAHNMHVAHDAKLSQSMDTNTH